MMKKLMVILFFSPLALGGEAPVKHLPSTEKVSFACDNQSRFYYFAAFASLLYVDPAIPPSEIYAKTGRYSNDTSAFDYNKKEAEKYGEKIMISKAGTERAIDYFYRNQDDAKLFSSMEYQSSFYKVCMLNPERYVISYKELESSGFMREK
ncbi:MULTISPECIES: hypothetical protein [Klebsiella]|uniref:hypothetical protein n=1 Tax=Klebsiella TaxID=570 RepID=UPI000F4EFB9B|nr:MULTISPECIES: hypothetical protein [Klebsiella]MDG0556611.1 hypothetical protein [Klebsiella quasipneumoniae]HBT4923467.1 hypothetical protein [Klebsiella pneumoniae]